MALELQSGIADPSDFTNATQVERERADRTIVNNIFGGTNYFASGRSQVNATTTNISVGNRQELDAALLGAGLSKQDLLSLSSAMDSDGKNAIGKKVTEWIKTTAPKVILNGLRLGGTVAEPVLTAWLKRQRDIQVSFVCARVQEMT
jgi:hypothetical protein